MDSIDRFRSLVSAKQTELILGKLVKKRESGEIRSEEELRSELDRALAEVSGGNRLTLEIPIRPWEKIESERFQKFFEDIGMDVNVLFTEVDHTEEVLDGLAQNIQVYLRNLQFTLGNLRSELIQRRLKADKGSGWSLISRDSFDRGYGKLLGRSEFTFDIFYDEIADVDQGYEKIDIKSDAKIEGLAKKLTLTETEEIPIGFKEIKIISGTTASNIPVENTIDIYHAIDSQSDTFWLHTIGRDKPIVGTATAEVNQIAGYSLSGNELDINLSGLLDQRAHELYVKLVEFSGITPRYICLDTLTDYKGPICRYDKGENCQYNYENQYSQNCINKNCARYSSDLLILSDLSGVLEDGYGWDTGAEIFFQNSNNLRPGQTWRVNIVPEGTTGAEVVLELTMTKPSNINWIELEPVVTSPMQVTALEYTKIGDTTRYPILSGTTQVIDKIRFDFRPVEAEKIYITFLQETYENADLYLNPRQQVLNKIDDLITRQNAPSISEFYDLGLESLLADYLPNGPMRNILESRSIKSSQIDGCFYTFGLFEINCGLSSYADSSIAITKEIRAITPRIIGIQANLEADIVYASGLDLGENGTIEFSMVRINYDKNNLHINTEDVPLPYLATDGTITERLFLNDSYTGSLRFPAQYINSIYLVNSQEYISSDYYTSENLYTYDTRVKNLTSISPNLKTFVTLTDRNIVDDSILLITYTPKYGVFLNPLKTVSIENNSNQILSLSNIPAVLVLSNKSVNRDIAYSDIYVRIILRRNDLNIYDSPGLRDYQVFIGEGDKGRFF